MESKRKLCSCKPYCELGGRYLCRHCKHWFCAYCMRCPQDPICSKCIQREFPPDTWHRVAFGSCCRQCPCGCGEIDVTSMACDVCNLWFKPSCIMTFPSQMEFTGSYECFAVFTQICHKCFEKTLSEAMKQFTGWPWNSCCAPSCKIVTRLRLFILEDFDKNPVANKMNKQRKILN